MNKMINVYQPKLGKEELDAIAKVFKSNWIGKGPMEEKFIEKFIEKLKPLQFDGMFSLSINPNQFITVNSGTEALFQIFKAILTDGDEVIIPSMSFVGGANAIFAAGGVPIYCDVDENNGNTTLEHIKTHITKKTKAIMVLHYAGRPCEDIFKIKKLCDNKGILLVEDSANSPFATIDNVTTGIIGDLGLWSFDPMKVITMGEGGLVFCKNPKLADKIRKNVYLGLNIESGAKNKGDKWWEFDIQSYGSKNIISDINAVIGIEQLKKVDDWIKKRKEIWDFYNNSFKNIELFKIPPPISPNCESSYYMYNLQINDPFQFHIIRGTRDRLANKLREIGIYTNFRYHPLHRIPLLKYKTIILPNTDTFVRNTICLPLHPHLKEDDIFQIINNVCKFAKEYETI